MKNIVSAIFALVLLISLTSGCSVNRAAAVLVPGSDLGRLKSFYIVTFAPDKKELDTLVQDHLLARGLIATHGPESSIPNQVDALVTYFDKWMWDMGNYMLELTVVFRDPKDKFPIASSNAVHTSLSRRSPKEMVEEVMDNIFQAKE